MNFFKSSYLSAISTLISITAKLIVNKLTAIFIGPNGFAIYGQFKDFVNLSTVLCQLGTENGVIKYSADTKHNIIQFKSFLSSAFKLHIISSILIALSIYVFRHSINSVLFDTNNDFSFQISIIGFTLIFIALYNFILSILNGLKQLKVFIFITILSTILTSVITILAVKYYVLQGLIISIALNHILVFALSVIFVFKTKKLKYSYFTSQFNKLHLRRLSQFTLMSLSGAVSLSLSLLFIRSHVIKTIGIEQAGFWDSVWRISALYLLFLTSSFKFYILPTFSKIQEKDIKKEILRIWKITFPSILLITSTVFLCKDFIIKILFTPEFLMIKSILLFQLLGDIIRIHSWVLGNVLIAKSYTKKFVILQIVWGIVFSLLSYIFIAYFKLAGTTIAYFATCLIHFGLLNFTLKKTIWYSNKTY